MDETGPTKPVGGMPRDWFRPVPTGRFAALVSPMAGGAAGLCSIGAMVGTDGTDIDPQAEVLGWPKNAGPAVTDVQARYDGDNLYLRVVCQEPSPERMRLHHPDLSRNDHVLISIDPVNDHHRCLYLLILPDGRCQATWSTQIYGYVPGDLVASGGVNSLAVGVKASIHMDSWQVDVTVPWKSLELATPAAGHCLGLNVSRFRTVAAEQIMEWSPTAGVPRDARYFGDLYIGQPAAILQEVRLGGPHWGMNRGYARFAAKGPFWAWIEPRECVTPVDAKPVRLEPGPYGFAGYRFDYVIDPLDILSGRLTIRWSTRNPAERVKDAAVSEASFVFGWKRSVLLTHAMGRPGKPARPAENTTPDFYSQMCDYFLSRLPRLARQGGRYLVSEDGVRIDLLEGDPLMPLARAVVERIEGLEDQLAACAMVLCQPEVLISSGTMSRLVHGANAASVLWVGGAFCDVYSMVLAGLVERVGHLNGRRIRTGLFWLPAPLGSKLPWPNHWWGCAWLENGLTLLDAELGRFFYRRDGRTLATAEDLFEDPSLADVAGKGLGDYFRLDKRTDGLVRLVPSWREIRPEGGEDDKVTR